MQFSSDGGKYDAAGRITDVPGGRNGSVGITTRCGLEDPGIEYRCGCEIFRTRPDRPWNLPSLLLSSYRAFLGGKATWAWR